MWKISFFNTFFVFPEFGDPSRRFCRCVAPNHVFTRFWLCLAPNRVVYDGFGVPLNSFLMFLNKIWAFCRDDLHFFIFVFSPLSSLFRFFFSFYDPSRLFFVFLFFVLLQKCSPLGLAEKINFYIFKRILFTIVFFGRSGARFYVIFQGLSNSQNG